MKKKLKMYAPWLAGGLAVGAIGLVWAAGGVFALGLLIGFAWIKFPVEREVKP